jgi:hypothetical protein
MTVLAVVGGFFGLVEFVRATRSLCQGEMTPVIASDDDLRPAPRLRRSAANDNVVRCAGA